MSEFKHRLDALVPSAPADAHRLASAATESAKRRGRRLTGALVAGTMIVGAGLFAAQFLPGGDGSVTAVPGETGTTTPGQSPPPSATVSGAAACPTETPTPETAAVTLPSGASELRWCTYPDPWGGTEPDLNPTAPPEPLTVGVDDWIEAFNTLEAHDPQEGCAADWAPLATAVLAYPDGTVRSVTGMDAGCHTLGGRLGFAQLRSLTIDLFTRQRVQLPPPAVVVEPCKGTSLLPAHVDELTRAEVCLPVDGSIVAGEVTDAAALIEDLRENRTRGSVAETTGAPRVQFYTPSGESLILAQATDGAAWHWEDHEGLWGWEPSAASQRALAAAAVHIEGQSHEEVCAGSLLAGVTDGAPTPGASRVWMCSWGRFAPLDPLVGDYADAWSSEEVPNHQACSPQHHDEWFIVEYPDGTRNRVDRPKADCGAFPRPEDFRSQLVRQRAAGDSPEVRAEPLPAPCEAHEQRSFMPVVIVEASEAMWCASGVDTLLGDSDRALLLADLAANSTEIGGTEPTAELRMALFWPGGDRLWLRDGGQAQTYHYVTPEGVAYEWVPTPQVLDILERVRTTGR